MGGSMSEPATLGDLGENIHSLYADPDIGPKIGISCPGFSVQELIQGVLFVDDALIASMVYCTSCLEAAMRKLWPADVGVTVEERGLPLTYLHARILPHGHSYQVVPFSPNAGFAQGLEDAPLFAKFPLFTSSYSNLTYIHLRTLLLERILSYNCTAEGNARKAKQAYIDLLCEILRLRWPVRWVAMVCRRVPRRHRTHFITMVRLFGKYMVQILPKHVFCDHPGVFDVRTEAKRAQHLHQHMLDAYERFLDFLDTPPPIAAIEHRGQ